MLLSQQISINQISYRSTCKHYTEERIFFLESLYLWLAPFEQHWHIGKKRHAAVGGDELSRSGWQAGKEAMEMIWDGPMRNLSFPSVSDHE
jgi:hypothetical protein